MKSKTRRSTIRNFDDFVEEAKMLPDGHEPDINITNPLELRLMEIADKHGILDQILDPDSDFYE